MSWQAHQPVNEEERRHDRSWNDPPMFTDDQLNKAAKVPIHKKYARVVAPEINPGPGYHGQQQPFNPMTSLPGTSQPSQQYGQQYGQQFGYGQQPQHQLPQPHQPQYQLPQPHQPQHQLPQPHQPQHQLPQPHQPQYQTQQTNQPHHQVTYGQPWDQQQRQY